jgi:hypothetical protein
MFVTNSNTSHIIKNMFYYEKARHDGLTNNIGRYSARYGQPDLVLADQQSQSALPASCSEMFVTVILAAMSD